MADGCRVCCITNTNRPRYRGREEVLPLPERRDGEVCFDLISLAGGPRGLFLQDSITGFVRAVVMEGDTSEEEVCKILLRE